VKRVVPGLAGVLLIAGAVSGCAGSSHPAGDRSAQQAVAAAARFLDRYVDSSGRVVRHDQGGDTVSEGQGYGLLLAYAARQPQRFATIWRWTQANLQQASGLFAYHWANGQVASTTPAADADTQIAWALDLAGRAWRVPSYTAAAKRIAGAVATTEIGYDAHGNPTLAAGPWAVQPDQPVTVEPGYWTYPADQSIAALTGDRRWQALADSDLAHLRASAADGRRLPADWAQLTGASGVTPAAQGSPGGPQAGPDGMRAVVWAACSPAGRVLDARWWQLISPSAAAAPLTRQLTGSPADTDQSALSEVAAAAAAAGAGQAATEQRLLDRAASIDRHYPTYYGAAWVALGRVLLTSHLLPGCG
jgi:endo-1,4-beta-D-glucanase Y